MPDPVDLTPEEYEWEPPWEPSWWAGILLYPLLFLAGISLLLFVFATCIFERRPLRNPGTGAILKNHIRTVLAYQAWREANEECRRSQEVPHAR